MNVTQKKTLYLAFNQPENDNVFLDKINETANIDATCALKSVNKFARIIRRVNLSHGWPGISIWLYNWKNHIEEYDRVICIASRYSPAILKWVKKRNPKAQCINYYWDSIKVSRYPVECSDAFENWTFSCDDAATYHMKYNPQFFVNDMKLPQEEVKYDITYVGADRQGTLKSRTELIKKYFSLFEKLNISNKIYYVSNDFSVPDKIRFGQLMPEEEFYRVCAEGKAVLDLVEPDVKWMTLRPLLALSNGKKVVTNNNEVINEPFYCKEDVFILGVDDTKNLSTFLNNNFKKIPEDVLKYYEITSWIDRFDY